MSASAATPDAVGELEPDLVGLEAPVVDYTGKVVTAVTLSAPLSRVPRERIPGSGAGAAGDGESLSKSLGHVPSRGQAASAAR